MLVLLFCTAVFVIPDFALAADYGGEEWVQQQIEDSGAAGLYDQLPDQTRELLEALGMADLSRESVYNLNIHRVLEVILGTAALFAGDISKTMLSVWGIMLLSALMESIRPDSSAPLARVFHAASVLFCGLALLQPLGELMEQVHTAMTASSAFQMVFVPIFAGIMAAGGQAVTAGKYSVLTVAAAQIGNTVLTGIILPLLRMCMALNITAAAAPTIRIDGVFASAKKMLTTLLGLIMTLFMTILSLQGAVGGAADSLTDKAAQFIISNTIPVVGGALSQAYTSVRGYVRLVKTTVGAFGMIAAGVLILPQLLSLILWRLMLDLTASAGDLFGQREIGSLLRNTSALLGVLLGILLCSGLMTMVSVGVMLLIRGGT